MSGCRRAKSACYPDVGEGANFYGNGRQPSGENGPQLFFAPAGGMSVPWISLITAATPA